MRAFQNISTSSKLILSIFGTLAVVYVLVTLLIPPDSSALSKYQLSEEEAKALGLTIALPYIIIWFIAVFGYFKLKRYSERIIESSDGQALSKIADGLFVLALWMPISTIISNLTTYYGRTHTDLQPAMVIINNYINLALVLGGFYLVYRGARLLPGIQKMLAGRKFSSSIWLGLFVVTSVSFTYFTLANPAREVPTPEVPVASYYLPDILLIISIILPYIFLFYFGIRAAEHVRAYAVMTSGVLYKSALRYLSSGLLFSVLAVMAVRLLASFTAWFNEQALNAVLGVIYLLLIGIAIGYVLIAIGAKRLQKIEDA